MLIREKARVLIQLRNELEECLGPPFDVETDISVYQLQLICNNLLKKDEIQSYNFFIDKDVAIVNSLDQSYDFISAGYEKTLNVYFFPQLLHRVYPVTRCTSSLPGHEGAILSIQFSPDGQKLASGSGDQTLRFWDLKTQTPLVTLKEHKHWVLCIAWSPNGKLLASADKNGKMCIWDATIGKLMGKPINAHNSWINCIAWEPLHKNANCKRFVSCSKDTILKVWDSGTRLCLMCLSGHTASVTYVKWGAKDLIYSSSQDRTIKIWNTNEGSLFRTLNSHAHWVNSLALSTDYILRTACFAYENMSKLEHNNSLVVLSAEEESRIALDRYKKLNPNDQERIVSASDDFTLCLWRDQLNPALPGETLSKNSTTDTYIIAKMTGHSQTVNHVQFSPDGSLIASASFDKSIKIWHGLTGKFLFTLRGHVQRVYQISFSNDSRLLISGSADSTLKIWKLDLSSCTPNQVSDVKKSRPNKRVKTLKGGDADNHKTVKYVSPKSYLCVDLPGHADEVFAIDWSPDGATVASGGKDKIIKIWKK